MSTIIVTLIGLSVACFVCAMACTVGSLLGYRITVKHCEIAEEIGSLLGVAAFYALALAFLLTFVS